MLRSQTSLGENLCPTNAFSPWENIVLYFMNEDFVLKVIHFPLHVILFVSCPDLFAYLALVQPVMLYNWLAIPPASNKVRELDFCYLENSHNFS